MLNVTEIKDIVNKIAVEYDLVIQEEDNFHILGGFSAGYKTTAAIKIAAAFQKLDQMVWLYDIEVCHLLNRLAEFGYFLDKGMYSSNRHSQEEILKHVEDSTVSVMPTPEIIVIDPISMVLSDKPLLNVGPGSVKHKNFIKRLQTEAKVSIGYKPYVIATCQLNRSQIRQGAQFKVDKDGKVKRNYL
jgi:hypothetical protein